MTGEYAWIAPLLTAAIAAVTFWAGWITKVLKGEAASSEVKKVAADLEAVKEDLGAFKVHVAATYASHDTIREVEQRLLDAINRLGDRLDKLFDPRPARK